jgi:hypothetical protein
LPHQRVWRPPVRGVSLFAARISSRRTDSGGGKAALDASRARRGTHVGSTDAAAGRSPTRSPSPIRAAYNWNRRFPGTSGSLDFLFAFSGTGGDLLGDVRLPNNWIADWRRMYDFPAGGRPALAAPGSNLNRAMRIDTRLTDPLADLPLGSFGGDPSIPKGDLRRNLAFRNLVRGNMVKLASGQQMVTRLKRAGESTSGR